MTGLLATIRRNLLEQTDVRPQTKLGELMGVLLNPIGQMELRFDLSLKFAPGPDARPERNASVPDEEANYFDEQDGDRLRLQSLCGWQPFRDAGELLDLIV